MSASVWTIGHSNQPVERFLALLERHGIEALADVRRFPGSRRWPQFGAEALAQRLDERASNISGSKNWADGADRCRTRPTTPGATQPFAAMRITWPAMNSPRA